MTDIPGVPTIMAVLVRLIAGRLLLRGEHVWLPRWLLERPVASGKLRKALTWLRSPARVIDRMWRPRLTRLHLPLTLAQRHRWDSSEPDTTIGTSSGKDTIMIAMPQP